MVVVGSDYNAHIRKLIFLTAYLPIHNESLIDINKQIPAPIQEKITPPALQFDFAQKLIHLKQQNLADLFYKDCSPEDQQFAIHHLQPQPLKPFITQIKLNKLFEQIPKEYIICTKDRILHPKTQQWLAVAAILFAIIGAYYYIRVVKVMYFEEPDTPTPFVYTRDTQVALSVSGLAVLYLGIFPGALFDLCQSLF